MRKDLVRIAEILSGHAEGIRESHDIEVVSHLTSALALNPEVGSPPQAKKLIDTFQRDAANLADACLVTARQLKQLVGRDGRPRSNWHDDFTALLLEIAEAGSVKPRLSTDRVSGERVGWLVEAALALEAFSRPKHALAKQRGVRQTPSAVLEEPQTAVGTKLSYCLRWFCPCDGPGALF